jgi:hypothetical protein
MSRMLLVVALVGACGGPQIPTHNGYKSEKARPWMKFKTLKFDEKGEAKVEGDLSYPDKRRAAWFGADLPVPGDLDLKVEITPPGETVNDDFDLGFEVLDTGNRPIIRKDIDEGDQTHELNKDAHLKSLAPGHYLIHLYLQSRMDTGEYVLRAVFKAGAPAEQKSDFPAQVAFVGALPMVPISDDTPKGYKPPTTAVVIHSTHHPVATHKDPPPPPPPTTLSARIINVSVVTGGTQITIGRGTSAGLKEGMHVRVKGVNSGSFAISACAERTCLATVSGVTPDQIRQSGSVEISP